MYCPSCDKSYGAVHSRCPECHSWLKVSAPANHRSKSAKSASLSGTFSETGSVSTLDKEPSVPWTEPAVGAETDWAKGSSDSWSDAIPAPALPTSLTDPAPAPDSGWGSTSSGWGGAAATSAGAAASSDSWGGAQDPKSQPGPASPRTPELSTPATGWLGGDGPADNWTAASPVSPAPSASPALSSPAKGLSMAEEDDGWGSTSSVAASTPSSSGMSLGVGGPPKPIPGPSQGWLGGDSSGPAHGGDKRQPAPESEAGWLTNSATAAAGAASTSAPASNGWLGGDDSSAPSMTEMVDRAIGVEEADDFVDDSWVDEEVTDGEFDDLEVPEYMPPAPEVGGAFIKMLLVAVLVLFIGGGVMFMGQEKKTPEQLQAEERTKELDFARSSVEMAKTNLDEGKPLLAVGPLEAAMTSFKTTGAEQKEILDTKVLLARALMKGQEYQKAYDHWAALTKAPKSYRKEAKDMMGEASKQLRIQANAGLDEANTYIKAGESTSVLSLGRSALKIFESHNGTPAQIGKAYGVIGRGYLNGREYGNAREALKKALALNPAGHYTADLNKIAAATTEQTSYYSGGGSSYRRAAAAPAQPRVITIDAQIDSGNSVPQGTYVPRQNRSSSSGSSSNSAPSVSSAPPKTQAIPAYRPSSRPSSSSGGRPGDKGVVPGYRSPR